MYYVRLNLCAHKISIEITWNFPSFAYQTALYGGKDMQIARRENGSISAMYGFCKLSSLKIDSKWCAWEEGVRKGKGRGGEDR